MLNKRRGSFCKISENRAECKGKESFFRSFLNGSRSTDHREISKIAYKRDAEGNEVLTGIETTMPDFIERGAIRIDANNGTINLNGKPTDAQRKALQRLIQRNGGDVTVDYGNGWDSEHYAEYEGANTRRVLADHTHDTKCRPT